MIVGVSGFSRFIGAWMIPSRESHDVLVVSAIGRWRGRDMCFTAEFPAFRGTLVIGALLCRRGHPEAKGLVERSNGYLESSFLPGRIFEESATSTASSAVGW